MKMRSTSGALTGHFAGLAGNGFRCFLDPNQAGGGTTAGAGQQNQAAGQAPQNQGQQAGQQQGANTGMTNAGAPPQQTQGAGGGHADPLANLATTIAAAIATAVTPMVQAVQQQGQQIAQVAQTIQGMTGVGNGGGTQGAPIVHGQAPSQRQGENIMGSRGYRLANIALFLQSGRNDNSFCKQELALSERLGKLYQSNGAGGIHEAGALYVPFASEHILAIDSDLGRECAQMLQAGIAGFTMDHAKQMAQWARSTGAANHPNSMMTQALSIYDDTALGLFVSQLQLGEMIPLVRASNALQLAGAREMTLLPNGQLPFGEQVGAVTAYHVGTGEAGQAIRTITESSPATGLRMMRARKLACLSRLPREFLQFATQSIEAFIRADMAIVMGLKESETLLFTGVGSDLMPKALINYANVNTVVAGTVGTDGNTVQPTDLDNMAATVEELNIPVDDRFTFIMRPMLAYKLANRRADAITAGDQAGPFVFLDLAINAVNARKNIIRGYNLVKSTQVPKDRVKGSSGATLTMIVGGDFREYVIGRHGVMQVDTATQGSNEFVRDEMLIRSITYYDGMPRREKAFCLMDSLRII